MNSVVNCVHFSGAKPCGKSKICDSACAHLQIRGKQILLIHLGALGAVVRSTALLQMISEKYPGSQITWVTQAPAHHLLQNHPALYRVLTTSMDSMLTLAALKFDVAFVVDKSIEATGILKHTQAREVFGFVSNEFGVILPATEAANELWSIGVDDHLKFRVNQKTEIQLISEALELAYNGQEYNLPLTTSEQDLMHIRKGQWSFHGQKVVVGINTGCANVISAKKLSIENHRELIRKIQKQTDWHVVLLGGPEDTERNFRISEGFHHITLSPTTGGLRDGLVSVAACDLVITGDSLGMHMAISQKVETVAWFGPTCANEIELYGRGAKVLSQAPCGPCWKRSCHKPVMCYDLVNLDEIINHALIRIRDSQNSDRPADGLFGRSSARSSAVDLG